jgi:hypothetical protein
MRNLRKLLAIITMVLGVVLSGCGTTPEPYDYGFNQALPTGPGEIKEGPGLFSGDDGVFTIYGQPSTPEEDSARENR